VGRHERFETLCAAASVGQASGDELADLREHLVGCPECQQSYSEFLELAAVRCATHPNEQGVSSDEAIGYIDSTIFRERFLKKAEAEGIVFSSGKFVAGMPEPQIRSSHAVKRRTGFALAVAASVVLAFGVIGGYRFGSRVVRGSSGVGSTSTRPSPSPDKGKSTDQNNLEAAFSRLEAENRRLSSEVNSLRISVADASSKVGKLQASAATSEKERASLTAAAQDRGVTIDVLRRQLNQAAVEVASVKSELEKAQTVNETTLVADRVKIRELSDQVAEQSSALERERDLLTANRDIRDLMAARNLHIADVFDTDPKGKTRAAFGRVFFTEGKSLIIYAYDLNDRRVQDAGYHYRVWGTKEGPGQAAKSLGVFYSDDKTQRRWVFKYDDPNVLSEIDSVFVTLEPPGKNPTKPKGDKFLYAYLHNQPNHP
jgi:hypothetical protein